MYDGYPSGVLGWNKPEETEEKRLEREKIEHFIGMIHHWASHYDRVAFVHDLGSVIDVSMTTRHIHTPLSDILNDRADPRQIVRDVIGRINP